MLIIGKIFFFFFSCGIFAYILCRKGEKTKDRPKLTKDDHVTTDTVDGKTPNIKASDLFFLALFWATGFVCIAKNLWILELLTVPFVIYVGKKLLVWIDNENALHECVRTFSAKLKVWAKERKDVLAPAPLRGITRTILLGDKKVRVDLTYVVTIGW